MGRWDGDALVVDTAAFATIPGSTGKGSPLTAAARITERFRRVPLRPARDRRHRNDPKAYARPWTVTLTQDLAVDTDLIDYHCTDNEKCTERMGGK